MDKHAKELFAVSEVISSFCFLIFMSYLDLCCAGCSLYASHPCRHDMGVAYIPDMVNRNPYRIWSIDFEYFGQIR